MLLFNIWCCPLISHEESVMKRLILFLLIFFVCLSAFSVVKVGVFQGKPLCYYEEGEFRGLYIDLIGEIASKNAIEVEFVPGEFSHLCELLKNGEINILPGIVYSAERSELYDFNEEHVLSSYGTVYIPEHSAFTSLLDLNGKKIAVAADSVNYTGPFGIKTVLDALNLQVEYLVKANYSEVLKAIHTEEADAGVVDSMFAALNAYNYKIKSTPIVLNPSDIRFGFTKGTPETKRLIERIDRSLKEMKEDSSSFFYQTINRYLHNMEYVDNPYLYYLLVLCAAVFFLFLFSIHYLQRGLKASTFEIERKKSELNIAEYKVEQTYSELKKSNEILKESLQKFENLVGIAGALGVRDLDEENFLKLYLRNTVAIIKEADYGSVSIIKRGEWEFVASEGYDLELLKSLHLKVDHMYLKKEVQIIDGLYNRYDQDFNKLSADILRRAVKPFKQSLIAPFYIDGEFAGNLSLDIAEESEAVFSEETKAIINAISGIAASFLEMKKNADTKERFQTNIVLSLVKALEYYDEYTRGHSERVAAYASMLSSRLGNSKEMTNKIYWASLVHDVGKIFIPRSILNKITTLTNAEFEEIKKHSEKGEEILKETEGMKEIARFVRHHHERYDGSGYPDRLKGDQIPIESQIIAIADSFDAMTSTRPYRNRMTYEEAVEDLRNCADFIYKKELVDAFISPELENLFSDFIKKSA